MVLAIDVGGTKLSAAVVDGDGRIHSARKVPVAKSSFRDTVDQIVSEAYDVIDESGASWDQITAIGVIVPGIADSETGAAYAHNLWGHSEVPLGGELRPRLPVAVHLESDRAGYVLGEQWLGVARGLTDVVFIALGTGIGAGILAGGKLIRGTGGVAGAVGWCALNPEFREEYRQLGCWEAEGAGPAVARLTQAESPQRAFDHACAYLIMGIANVIAVLNPQMVVLGGGLMQSGQIPLESIRRGVRRWAQPRAADQVRIELTALGENAGLLGAARIAMNGAGT